MKKSHQIANTIKPAIMSRPINIHMSTERKKLPLRQELSAYQAAATKAMAKVAETEDALIEETLGSNPPLQKVDLLLEHLENNCFDLSGRQIVSPKRFTIFRNARLIIRDKEKKWRSSVNKDKELYAKSEDRSLRKHALEEALFEKYLDLNCIIFENLEINFAEDLMRLFKVSASKSIRDRLQEDEFADGEVLFTGSTRNEHFPPLGLETRIDGIRLAPRFNCENIGKVGIDISLHFDKSAVEQIYESSPLPELAA